MKPERITYRFYPCNCGCNGSDPWHKQSYRRIVRGVREESGKASTKDIGVKEYNRVGFIRLPMSTQRVRVIDINMYTDGPHWVVDYDSVEFDK